MTEQAAPIQVRQSAATDLTWQAVRAAVIFGAGAGSVQVFHSEMVAGLAVAAVTALLAALPAAVAYGFGVFRTLTTHHEKKVMAQRLPDQIATVVP